MTAALRLGGAAAALLVGLLAILPPSLSAERDDPVLLDDADRDGARSCPHGAMGALPAPSPQFSALRPCGRLITTAGPELSPPEFGPSLPSRAPPRP